MSRADEVIAELRTAPDGMTTLEMSKRLSAPEYTVSSLLSKLCVYGKIDKYKPPEQKHNKTIWRAKPDVDA